MGEGRSRYSFSGVGISASEERAHGGHARVASGLPPAAGEVHLREQIVCRRRHRNRSQEGRSRRRSRGSFSGISERRAWEQSQQRLKPNHHVHISNGRELRVHSRQCIWLRQQHGCLRPFSGPEPDEAG